jgi:YaiO family outer membrane protein
MKHFICLSFILGILSVGLYAQNRPEDAQNVRKIGLNYSFINFDKRFPDPWHLASFSYSQQKKWGYAGLNFNYANRFQKNGSELELETYPRIVKGTYAYAALATKLSSNSLFPNYRIGFSLYQSLPNKFELETGIRHLAFSNITNIGVLGIGKYVGNYYLNLRSYWNRRDGNWSESFNLSVRRYLSDDRHDYWSVNVGTGVSADDQTQLNNTVFQLNTYRVGTDYSKNINSRTIVKAGIQLMSEEYDPNTFGTQIGLNFGIYHKLQ